MFFGKILNKNRPFPYTAESVEAVNGEVLSITNLALDPKSEEPASLFIKKQDGEYLIATATKEKPHQMLNLFISLADKITLIVKGNGSVHVSGFIEPDQAEGLDGMAFD